MIMQRGRVLVLSAAVVGLTAAGCASTSSGGTAAPLELESPQTYGQPVEAVHGAAEDAMAVYGFNINTNEPTYLEGKRPNKIGFFVGSGGEIIKISLTAVDENQTEVTVETQKTAFGYAGQRNWDSEILTEMDAALEGAAPEGAAPEEAAPEEAAPEEAASE